MGKIFARERGRVGKGAGRPRFEIVAVSGVDLKIYHSHVRREELEALAGDLEAELVWLPRGEGSGQGEGEPVGPEKRKGRRGRKGGKGRHREQE